MTSLVDFLAGVGRGFREVLVIFGIFSIISLICSVLVIFSPIEVLAVVAVSVVFFVKASFVHISVHEWWLGVISAVFREPVVPRRVPFLSSITVFKGVSVRRRVMLIPIIPFISEVGIFFRVPLFLPISIILWVPIIFGVSFVFGISLIS